MEEKHKKEYEELKLRLQEEEKQKAQQAHSTYFFQNIGICIGLERKEP
jgi:hypothetical protein